MAGNRWSRFVAAALSLWMVALVAPGAAPALGEPDTGGFGAFNLKASNGYSMTVLANSGPGYKQGEVLVWLSRRDGFVSYFAPATVTDTRIDADLGTVGRIAVEFEPSGEKGKAAPVCEPEDGIPYDKGSYVGEVDFHGEEGYADASATRVPFSLHPYIDLLCDGVSIGEAFGHGIPGARLTAHVRLGRGRVSLQINQNRPDAPVRTQASIVERRDGILIEREVGGTDPGRAFEFGGRALSFAAARLDAPFSGTGTFRRGANPANRWTGNLAVDFPGHSNVSLTGNRFRVKLIHARLSKEVFRRTERRKAAG